MVALASDHTPVAILEKNPGIRTRKTINILVVDKDDNRRIKTYLALNRLGLAHMMNAVLSHNAEDAAGVISMHRQTPDQFELVVIHESAKLFWGGGELKISLTVFQQGPLPYIEIDGNDHTTEDFGVRVRHALGIEA